VSRLWWRFLRRGGSRRGREEKEIILLMTVGEFKTWLEENKVPEETEMKDGYYGDHIAPVFFPPTKRDPIPTLII
jgi:hypothetical protein